MARTTKKPAKRAAPASRKAPARKAAAKPKAAKAAAKPTSMTGQLPPIVTLKHLAEWAGYNHGLPKQQATAMLSGFVSDIGRALKKGSKIRIPDLGILQVRVRPARPARRGRNPATGEEIMIKASKASKRVAFRPAKTLKETV
jgi:DNA-binding protein HU-beta